MITECFLCLEQLRFLIVLGVITAQRMHHDFCHLVVYVIHDEKTKQKCLIAMGYVDVPNILMHCKCYFTPN